MKTFIRIASAAAMVVSLLATSPAMAFGLGSAGRTLGKDTAFIALKSRTVAPFAHVMFCVKQPGDCNSSGRGSIVTMTAAKREVLGAINRKVNRSIRPQNDDRNKMGGDDWALAPKSGDCEDFAITKRHALIKQGWPSGALRLAVAHTYSGEGHLVLVVRTTDGDLVLDNLTSSIRNWKRTGLRWEKIQSSENPRVWYNL